MITIRKKSVADKKWVRFITLKYWGSEMVVVHGESYSPEELSGLVAEENGNRVGLLTYKIEDHACEIVTVNSLQEGRGIGRMLVDRVKEIAGKANCQKLWLITTNDNLEALKFYQLCGFKIIAVYADAVTRSRKIKPEIPEYGETGIPIRDELALELGL